jgi:hypothetical protein
MLKTSAIAACVLALSGTAALAQNHWWDSWIPNAPKDAPYGTNGPARRSVGGDPNVNHTYNGTTSSSTISRADQKWDSAHGATSTPAVATQGPGPQQDQYMAESPARYQPQAQAQYQAQVPAAAPQLDEPMSRPHQVFITDEHGFRYDRKGYRLDSRGYVMR